MHHTPPPPLAASRSGSRLFHALAPQQRVAVSLPIAMEMLALLPGLLAVIFLIGAPAVQAQSPAAKAPEKSLASGTPKGAEPPRFVLVSAGTFTMGDAFDKDPRAPLHKVSVSAFQMQKTEVSKAEWDEVHAWGLKNGYTELPEGNGKAADHPVQTICWYDVVKWCNAKSVKEGLIPCYYTEAAQTVVYQTGKTDLDSAMVKWGANGYRLPTEAEWEMAARGGLSGKRFPWGDTISHEQENFNNDSNDAFEKGTTGLHPSYRTGTRPFTAPVGSFAPNGYGLHDMAGNVFEWCWDRYEDEVDSVVPLTDPRGATSGKQWFATASYDFAYNPNELVIWSVRKDGSFKRELQDEPGRWGPTFLQWLSPTRLRVRCESPQENFGPPDPKPVARIFEFANGKWHQIGDTEPWTE